MNKLKLIQFFLCFVIILSWISCSDYKPVKIIYGQDVCDYCKMNIVQAPFASQLITNKGKILKYDSIECLAAYTIKDSNSYEEAHSLWVTNFEEPENFLEIHNVQFLYGGSINSPMGVGLIAVENQQFQSSQLKNKYDGRLVSWIEVRQIVEEAWNITK